MIKFWHSELWFFLFCVIACIGLNVKYLDGMTLLLSTEQKRAVHIKVLRRKLFNALEKKNIESVRQLLKSCEKVSAVFFLQVTTSDFMKELSQSFGQEAGEILQNYHELREQFLEQAGSMALVRAISYDLTDVAREIIVRCKHHSNVINLLYLVTQKNENGVTALMLMRNQHLSILQEIFDSFKRFDCPEFIVSSINATCIKIKNTALMHAIGNGNFAIVQEMLARCSTKEMLLSVLRAKNIYGETPLSQASRQRESAIVEELLMHCSQRKISPQELETFIKEIPGVNYGKDQAFLANALTLQDFALVHEFFAGLFNSVAFF